MFQITSSAISRDLCIESLETHKAGGLVVFEGWVRNHNEGKPVGSLEYQVYKELAQKEGERILLEAKEKFNLHAVGAVHREGHLQLGDCAVWIGATASHRDDAFKATRYVIDEIKLRLPIWKKEHYVSGKADWVYCKDHHTHVHFHEKDYYQKQAVLVDQKKLHDAKVLVVGAGGLGCPALVGLTAAGVGHIHVVDFDVIEISNIHRQPLYSPHQVGEKKAVVAQNRMMELNPFVHVSHGTDFVSAANVLSLVQKADLVLDCTDNMRAKFLLHDACFQLGKPMISASVFKNEAQLRSFVPGGENGCWRCVVGQTPEDHFVGNCNDFGVVAPTLGFVGSLMASEALGLLQNGSNVSLAYTLLLDVKNLTQTRIKNTAKQNCVCCAGQAGLETRDFEMLAADLQPGDKIVDVRNLPDEALRDFVSASEKVAVVCHRGVRSARLVQAMRNSGHGHFYSVIGGYKEVEKFK